MTPDQMAAYRALAAKVQQLRMVGFEPELAGAVTALADEVERLRARAETKNVGMRAVDIAEMALMKAEAES